MPVTRSNTSRITHQDDPVPVTRSRSGVGASRPDDPVVEVRIIYERSPLQKMLTRPCVKYLMSAWFWWGALCTYGVYASAAMLVAVICAFSE